MLERERDERDLDAVVLERSDRQRDAVDRERALLDAVALELGGQLESQAGAGALGVEGSDPRAAVDVALDEVAAERLASA